MEKILLPFLTSLLITVICVPITVKLANRFKLVDNPKNRPHPAHIHSKTVPRAGGLPVFLGILASILIFLPMEKYITGLIVGSFLLLVIGLLDDLLPALSPYPRLIVQVAAAAIIVASGVGISFITSPLGGILRLDDIVLPFNFFGPHTIVLIADIFAFLWIVWMMNMVNWSKGVDGQMPGIVTVASLTIAWVAYKAYLKGDPNQLNISMLGFIVSGSAFGFLLFNWHPAKIFPGFSGSTVFGFIIATICILTSAKLATALLVLLIPSIDFFYTFFRRIATHTNPLYGDQKHLHHMLLQKGWSHQKISLFYITSSAVLGLAAINLSSQGKIFAILGIGVVILGVILWLHLFSQTKNE